MGEHAVEQHGEALAPAVTDKPRYVVLHRPEILPGVALADIWRVVVGVERTHEIAVAAAGLHIAGGGVVDVAPIACARGKFAREARTVERAQSAPPCHSAFRPRKRRHFDF